MSNFWGFSDVTNELPLHASIIRQSTILDWIIFICFFPVSSPLTQCEQPRRTIAQLAWEQTGWLNINQNERKTKVEQD